MNLHDLRKKHSKLADERRAAQLTASTAAATQDRVTGAIIGHALEAESRVARLEGDLERAKAIIADLKGEQPAPPKPEPDPEEPGTGEPDPDPGVPPVWPADDVFARLERSREENIRDARGRFSLRKREKGRRIPNSMTVGGNLPVDVRDAIQDLDWQWGTNRALITRSVDGLPAADTFGSIGTGRVAVAPPPISLLSNLELGDFKGAAQRDAKWWNRLYNNRRVVAEELFGICPRKPGSQFEPMLSEHAVYAEYTESFEMRACYLEGFGGHGPYGPYRPMDFQQYTGANGFATSPMLFHVHDTALVNMDQSPGRGSFAVQAFNCGDFVHGGTVLLEDLEVYLGWDFVRSQGRWDPVPFTPELTPERAGGREMNCNGVFGLNHYDLEQHQMRASAHFPGLKRSHPTELVRINRNTWDISWSRMPMAVIRGAKKVEIENSAVRAHPFHKSPWISIDDDDLQRFVAPCKEIVVRNCVFQDAGVRVFVGSASEKRAIECPRDLRGKVAIWKTGRTEFEVRDLDIERVHQGGVRKVPAA